MSVDTFWKRVPVEAIRGRSPDEIYALVPSWSDDAFAGEREAGVLLGVEDTGALIDALLVAGAAGGPNEAAARAFEAGPADWDDDCAVGTFDPERVRQLARFLSAAPLEHWVRQHHAALAAAARSMGYRRPFNDEWAEQLLDDAREVAVLFEAAAAHDEAIIVMCSG